MRPPKRVARELGRAIRQIRLKRHLTQQEVADRCGLDIGYVGGIERGQRNPTIGVIHSLATILRVRASELLRRAKL